MASPDTITVPQLARLLGTPEAPLLLDVRTEEDGAAKARILPASQHRDHGTVRDWAPGLVGRHVVVACARGLKVSEGVAAWLRHAGVRAEVLEGGVGAWRDAGQPLLDATRMPPRDALGRTIEVLPRGPQ